MQPRGSDLLPGDLLPADLPAVNLDRDLFKQALLNLFLNAQQAMPGGGELTIQAVREPNAVTLSLNKNF